MTTLTITAEIQPLNGEKELVRITLTTSLPFEQVDNYKVVQAVFPSHRIFNAQRIGEVVV